MMLSSGLAAFKELAHFSDPLRISQLIRTVNHDPFVLKLCILPQVMLKLFLRLAGTENQNLIKGKQEMRDCLEIFQLFGSFRIAHCMFTPSPLRYCSFYLVQDR